MNGEFEWDLETVGGTALIAVDGEIVPGHVTAIHGDSIESISDGCKRVDENRDVLVRGFRIGEGLAHDVTFIRNVCSVSLGGDEWLSNPVMADVRYA